MSDFFARPDGDVPSLIAPETFQVDGVAVSPPTLLLVALGIEFAMSLACFQPATKPFHIAGYFIGAVAMALTAVTYRSIDRKRQRSRTYVALPFQGRLVVGLLVAAVVLAAAHAYYLAQSQVIAR